MQYEAPQVLQTIDANFQIMGGHKGNDILQDAMNHLEFNATVGAYEADE